MNKRDGVIGALIDWLKPKPPQQDVTLTWQQAAAIEASLNELADLRTLIVDAENAVGWGEGIGIDRYMENHNGDGKRWADALAVAKAAA